MVRVKQFLIVLTIVLLINPAPSVDYVFAENNLDSKDYIEIKTSEDLEKIKKDLTKDYQLAADIDLKDIDWEPIGLEEEKKFTGKFIGNKYKILNMPAEFSDDENLGLFYKIDNIEDIDVDIEYTHEVDSDKATEEKVEKAEQKSETSKEASETEEEKTETKDEQKTESKKETEDKKEAEKQSTEEKTNIQDESSEKTETKKAEKTKQDAESKEAEKENPDTKTKETEKAEENSASKEVSEADDEIATFSSEPIETATGYASDVTDFSTLKAALENKDITEVNVRRDIEYRGNLGNRIKIAPRVSGQKLVINGHGNELKQSGGLYTALRANLIDNQATNITFKNINLVTDNSEPLIIQTGADLAWNLTFENVNKNVSKKSNSQLVEATDAHIIFKGSVNFTSDANVIDGAKSITVKSGQTNIATKEEFYTTKVHGATLKVDPDATLHIDALTNDSGPLIEMEDSYSKIHVDGGRLEINSERDFEGIRTVAQTRRGLIRFLKDDVQFNVSNKGKVDINHNKGSIIFMESDRGQINLTDNSEANFIAAGGKGDHDAVIHMNQARTYEINLDGGSILNVKKFAGKGMALRVGLDKGPHGNKFNIKGASRFNVYNKGDGTPRDPWGNEGRNQALYFHSKDAKVLPTFTLEGKGSEVELIADNGIAMHMTEGGNITANEGTTFIAHGKTASNDRGVIDTGGNVDKGSQFIMDNPAFYDFRNNNNNGFVFHVGDKTIMRGIATDIATWKRGTNLDAKHAWRFLDVTYKFGDFDFSGIKESNSSSLSREVNNRNGLKSYARISGNNAQAVVNHLYQTTDADQKVYAHVSVDEGMFGHRNVYTDEAEVDVLITKANGDTKELTGHTKGIESFPNESVYKIYDKPVEIKTKRELAEGNVIDTDKIRDDGFGWAEIVLEDDTYLEAGDKIEVTGARVIDSDRKVGGKVVESSTANFTTDKRTTVDVTPPEPAELMSVELTEGMKVLKGKLPKEAVTISVERNGVDAGGTVSQDQETKEFEYDFPEVLKVGDVIQIFLTDTSGKANGLGEALDRPDRPTTNLAAGNINPHRKYRYHDKEFEKGTTVHVVEATGELVFVSAPKLLSFNPKITSYTAEYLVDLSKLDKDLVVSDQRSVKSDWSVMAKMSKQLTDDASNELTDALIYREGERDLRLNNEDITIKRHEYENSNAPNGQWNLISNWYDKNSDDGLYLEVLPGQGEVGTEYTGEVTWTLTDAPS